ncbi:uncharacterized protein Tco025E_01663 [Trypanosoma conorhini]|uniref:Uncharacterized protein n=1 Tax=Trypanosoma conorhini TaxID=83891 RepID=A0A3R7PJE4_9TRYP|nr:uncharacterized protein Tco025E_01663 [Trypanosoma conorhini]RNF26199.1 hypothetical protein Tco025E_01663 [Trypanosoma conorhini]
MCEAQRERRGQTATSSASASSSDSGGRRYTAAEELAAQIVDCASLLTCMNAEEAVGSIRPLSPRSRAVTACVSWRTAAPAPGDVRSVDVRFSYAEAFTCLPKSGGDCAYESLMALLVANGCGVAAAA